MPHLYCLFYFINPLTVLEQHHSCHIFGARAYLCDFFSWLCTFSRIRPYFGCGFFFPSSPELYCRLRPYLPTDCFTTVVCGLVTIRLDYCNSLLARLTVKLSPLQSVVNAGAGLLVELSNYHFFLPCILQIASLKIGRGGPCATCVDL